MYIYRFVLLLNIGKCIFKIFFRFFFLNKKLIEFYYVLIKFILNVIKII